MNGDMDYDEFIVYQAKLLAEYVKQFMPKEAESLGKE